MPVLNVGFDAGSSDSKIIIGVDGKNYQPLAMSPHIIKIDRELLPQYGGVNPSGSSWVGIGDEYYAVGALAQSYHSFASLKSLKIDSIVPKILAAVWVAIESLKLDGKITLNLACLLPPGEMKGGQAGVLAQQLSAALKNFSAPTGKIKVKLAYFNAYPEGMGLYLIHQIYESDFKESNVAISMLGYRNASRFYCRQGVISGYESTDYGFDFLVQQVRRKTYDYNSYLLTFAIANYQDKQDDSFLIGILRNRDDRRKAQELAALKSAIESARRLYLGLITSWYEETIGSDINIILVGGGTADYLAPDLKLYLESKVGGKGKVGIHSSINLPASIEKMNMGYRFVDCYVIWLQLIKDVMN
jgi:hypothetical protein